MGALFLLMGDLLLSRRQDRGGSDACVHVSCGCTVAGCCFECPLEVCIFDIPLSNQVRSERRERLQGLVASGVGRKRIATLTGISERQVWRITKADA